MVISSLISLFSQQLSFITEFCPTRKKTFRHDYHNERFSYAGDRNRTGTVLPQQDFKSCASASSATPAFINEIIINIMGRGGFEPPKQVAADLQSVPFGHSGICPFTIYTYITLLKKVQQHLLQIPNYFHYIHQIFFFFILIFDTKLY